MKTGFPKLPDDHAASSLYEWLYRVKAAELGLNWENTTAKEVKKFRRFWSCDVAFRLWDVIGGLQQSGGALSSMSHIIQIWTACRLDRVAQCKRSRCGRFFFSAKSAKKYCHSSCRRKDIEEQYDTDAYREKKKQAMRRGRVAKTAQRVAKANAKRRNR